MDLSSREKVLICIVMIMAVINIYFLYVRHCGNQPYVAPESIDSMFVEEEENKPIIVHVAGQVNRKGIVVLEEGARVFDAVQAAGGSKEQADLDRVNLAKVVADGEKVYIPAVGEEMHGLSDCYIDDVNNRSININTASITELETLSGIGPVIARRIVEFREREGRFNSPEDIMKVSGIGAKVYEGIKDSIIAK